MFYIYKNILTTVSGTVQADTLKTSGLCLQIFVKSTTSTTDFDFQLIDEDDNIVFERDRETGILNELLNFPMSEIYTVKILNSSVDEAFTIKLFIQEF